MAIARLTFVLAAQIALCSGVLAAERPNFVFVLTDDQRFDTLGCMGNAILPTPHIDRLAAEGTLFRNAFCTTSICAVSRANFMTGQYAARHGVNNFVTPLSAEQLAETFPGVLRRAGYRTGLVGKWGIGGAMPSGEYDWFAGYDGQGNYFPDGKQGEPGEHLTDRQTKQALEFLGTCNADQPFLLQFYTKAAHAQDGDPWPYQCDARFNDLFANVTIPKPRTATEAHFRALPSFLQESEGHIRWQPRFANDELYQKSVKDYYRLVVGIDDAVGAIVAKLEELGVADNTVIVYSSDNGYYLGDYGLADKWFMHEPSIRLPLIVCDPRQPKERRGTTVDDKVLSIDVCPTILELAGAEIPQRVQGQSLVPLIEGREVAWRDDFFYEHHVRHPKIPDSEGVRGERWKYVRYVQLDPPVEQLYDLETDPYEEHDLASDPKFAPQLATMRTRWEELRESAR